jgi:AraC-like DNA-binding protein
MESFARPINLFLETTTNRHYRSLGTERPNDDYYIFHHTLEGHGVFRDARGESPIHPGQGFLVKANNPAGAYWYPRDSKDLWKWLSFTFTGGAASLMAEDLIKRYGGVFTVRLTATRLHEIFLSLKSKSTILGLNAVDGAALVNELLSTLVTSSERGETQTQGTGLPYQALALIKTEPGVTVSGLAKKLRVSREHLARVYRQSFNKSLHATIEQERLKIAAQLLGETRLSIKEISGEAGYQTFTSFSKAFRRVRGVSPGEFRMRRYVLGGAIGDTLNVQ